MALPPKIYQFLVCIFAAVGSFLYGYDLSIVASITVSQSFLDKFQPTKVELGLVASLLTAGGFCGAGIAGSTSDLLGRRLTILLGGLVFCLGAALQTGAQAYSYIIAGRLIGGIGIGILLMIVPLYQAELAHPSIRGLVTGLQQFMLGIGGVVGAFLAYGTYIHFTDDRQWRIPFGVQLAPAGIVTALILFFPESPRWLFQKDRHDDALAALARLHSNGDQEDPFVAMEAEQIRESVRAEKAAGQVALFQIFSTRANARRIVLAAAIQAATQMTGISAIQYYSTTIFKEIGIADRDTLKYQAINSIIGLLGEAAMMFTVDRIGRRPLLIAGSLAMAATYIVNTTLLAEFPPSSNNSSAHWGFIFMTWIFNFCFASTGSLSWIIPAEIFDTKTRSVGVALSCMTSFAFNTMIGQVTPLGLEMVRWRFYLLFVVTNITNALFFWAFLPETKQLALEDMNTLFTKTSWFVGWRAQEQRVSVQERVDDRRESLKNSVMIHEESI